MQLRTAVASTMSAAALLGGVMFGSPVAASANAGSTAVAHRDVAVCPTPPSGYAHCHAMVSEAATSNGRTAPAATSGPTGLDPSTYMLDYGWANSTGSLIGTGAGQTIAVVDAYDDPTIVSDLNTFDSQFGLACNACLDKVNQSGGTSYPRSNSGWALEISLDVEWAHAIAPNATILLVEASSNSFSNLLAAEDYATQHAAYVTNSWGGSEFSSESSYDSHFNHPAVSYFASAGDTGGAVEYPSASPYVVSVGGTTLHNTGGTVTETGWSSSGGGCSAYEAANSSQDTQPVTCTGRGTPDVASDADPNTGVSVYDTTSYYGQTGWFVVGGTSAASPVWAARSADRGAIVNAAYVYAGYNGNPSVAYGTNIAFRDVTSGSNGYSAGPGYDLVTGLGTWTGGDSSTTSTGGGTTSSNVTITSKSCSGATCSFTVAGTAPYNWDFGDGTTITGTNNTSESDTYAAAGTYTVTITDALPSSTSATVTCNAKGNPKRPSLSCSVA